VNSARLTLIVRAYCHLCDDMRDQLNALLALMRQTRAAIVEIDVDGDPLLEARWGDKVPVLLLEDHELCHYALDRDAVRRALAATAVGFDRHES